MIKENNIFTYATSELSQDAFLFYLLNFANKDSNEGKLARDFLKTFGCDKINEINFKDFKIYSYKQYKHIDLLMLFLDEKDVENKSFLLLVEDKINANESKENQLNSYIEKINEIAQEDINGQKIDSKSYEKLKNKEILKKIIVPVYLKTGNMSTEEMEYIKKKSNLIDLEKISSLLKHDVSNIIINQWKERIIQLKELNKKIVVYIEENKTIEEICDLCSNYGCDSLEAMNQMGKAIFDGKHKIGSHSKFYNNDETYNYTTWKQNAMGHPEANLSIKADFLYKKLDDEEYSKKNPDKQLFISTQLRIRNFDLCIVFEILIFNKNTNKNKITNKHYEYNTWATGSFLNKNQSIKKQFNKEKEDFYEKISKKIDDTMKKNSKFSDAAIGKLSSRNIILTKFDWEEWIKNLKFSDFKEFILDLQKILEETAIDCGFEKLW